MTKLSPSICICAGGKGFDATHRYQSDRMQSSANSLNRLNERLRRTASLPLKVGENRKVAVKIVDGSGVESLKILVLP